MIYRILLILEVKAVTHILRFCLHLNSMFKCFMNGRSSFDQKGVADMLLIVQCDCGDQNADLVACARYTVQGELQQVQEDRIDGIHVVFLIQLPGIAGGCFSGFQVLINVIFVLFVSQDYLFLCKVAHRFKILHLCFKK